MKDRVRLRRQVAIAFLIILNLVVCLATVFYNRKRAALEAIFMPPEPPPAAFPVRWEAHRSPVDVSVLPPRQVTFNQDVAPIIYGRCATCHQAGDAGQIELTSYEQVVKHGKQIAEVTRERFMPPWKPEPGYGDFVGDMDLSDDEVKLIWQWVKQGMPRGSGSEAANPPGAKNGWAFGQPDLVVKMPRPYKVPAEGRGDYRAFVIPLDIAKDEYVSAVEFRPSNRRVLHHVIVFTDRSGAGRKLEARATDNAAGYPSFGGGPGFMPDGVLAGWAPGVAPIRLPPDVGLELKTGTDLVVLSHFHPTGKVEEEQSTVGIYFSKNKPARMHRSLEIGSRAIMIPPGDGAHHVSYGFTVPIDIDVLNIAPHGHLLLKEVRGTATLPDGHEEPLIWIRDWDFYVQRQYWYKKPLRLPRGTHIRMDYVYDNSRENPHNPSSPPAWVKWGETTLDEMADFHIQLVCANESDLPELDALLQQVEYMRQDALREEASR